MLDRTNRRTRGVGLAELATNAAKYGALSSSGRLEMNWEVSPRRIVSMARDRRPSPMRAPDRGSAPVITQQVTANLAQATFDG